MPDDTRAVDSEIISAAYAERVTDAFRMFAENLGMGQSDHSCKERFFRAVQVIRKARDLALSTLDELDAPVHAAAEAAGEKKAEVSASDAADLAMEGLSPEDRAIVEQALGRTTGTKPPPPPTPIRR